LGRPPARSPAGLFRRPPTEPDGRLSIASGSPVVTLENGRDSRPSRPLLVPVVSRLPSFAVGTAFPSADYYEGSVALGLAPGRRSRVFRRSTSESDVGGPFVPLRDLIDPRLPDGRSPPLRGDGSVPGAPPVGCIEEPRLMPLGTRLQAIQLSPYHSDLAGPCRTPFRASPALRTCSGPRWLSPLGKSVGPTVSFRTVPTCGRDRDVC